MVRISSLILIGISLALSSAFSTAEDIPEDDFNQMCEACESCCSGYDNVEIVEPISDTNRPGKAVKKANNISKKSVTKKNTQDKTNAWLKASLFGSTISGASLSPSTSYTSNGQFRVVINSLFSFDCALKFNNLGDPSKLSHCKPKLKGGSWRVKEKNIALDCSNNSTSSICTGSYTLAFSEDEDRNETHKITLSKRR